MIEKQQLEDVREQLQEDLQCILDGDDPKKINDACQAVVDRFAVLISAQTQKEG